MIRVGAVLIMMTASLVSCQKPLSSKNDESQKPAPLENVGKLLSGEGNNGTSDPSEQPNEVTPPLVPVAQPVPNKPGFVISPYNGKWIDVTGIPAGELMLDPHFPSEEKKFFRVPGNEPPAQPPEQPAKLPDTV